MTDNNQKQLLRILYEQGNISLYAWHKKTCLSPICIANAVQALRKQGVLQLSGDHENATLTEYGRKWIELNSKELFATKGDEPWKNVPEGMASEGDALFDTFYEVSDIQKLLDNINK